MADVELIVQPGLPEWGVDIPALREALARAGVRMSGQASDRDPARAAKVVVGDLEGVDDLLVRHGGSRPLVLLQGDHFPHLRPRLNPAAGWQERAAGVVFCVWGAAARDELAARFPDARIIVTGLPRADPDLIKRMPHASPPPVERSGGVLLLTAPGAPLDPSLRALAERLGPLFGDSARVGVPADLLGAGGAPPAVAVASSAAGYVPALRAGVPLIVLDRPGAPRRLPVLKHHLVAHADDVDRAEELVAATLATGRFQGNSAGDLVERFVARADGVDDAVRAISAAASGVGSTIWAAGEAAQTPAVTGRWGARIAVIGANFGRDVGLAIPVMTLAESLTASGRTTVRYLDARAFTTERQYREWIQPDDTLLVNGLETLTTAPALRRFVQGRLDAGARAFVYIHLTEAGLERERSRRPGELDAALRLLRRCTVLCVSAYQERLFRGLGVHRTRVVYNTSPTLAGTAEASPPAARPVPDAPTIVMVGTVQERKGVDLFSRVADLAAEQHPEWRFAWAGAPTGPLPPGVLQSDRVAWLGRLDRDRIDDLLRTADAFFLSSRDDPMPLAVVEAIGAGLRVVSFDRVGASEILADADGYAAFAEYTPAAALRAIESALAAVPDRERWREARSRFTVDAFEERMRKALEVEPAGSAGPSPLAEAVPPAFPVPVETLADPALPPALGSVLRRAAGRHTVDRTARLALAERLLAAGDLTGAHDAMAAARIRRLPRQPQVHTLAARLRQAQRKPTVLRVASAAYRRSVSWGRRFRSLAHQRR
ncbi:glycosyltransferase family 4 protein [Lysobacter korlensis]|uniref:Glycosyltransferase family 4 protein n=1 Tax=Lysobacter korlensis TaxID=553636 RepID=A0ABV6RYJ0_9GAMM